MSPLPNAGTSADILATAVIPWTERHELDEETFCRQVQTIARDLTRDIYIFGTAGEGYAVTDAQFDRIVTTFARCSHEYGVAPMVGIISLSLPTTIERIARARAKGIRSFQLSLPSWGALNDRELDRFFAETCAAFPDCQFHHYNLARTKRVLTSVEYSRLAAAHANLVAVKASPRDPEVVADLLKVSPRLRLYLTETGYAIARRTTREVGLLISLASLNARRAHAFVAGDDARREADLAELLAIAGKMAEVAAGRFHIDGAYDKMLFRTIDPTFPLRLLPPYASATEEEHARFADAVPPGWRSR
jgi:dihydrodipicolinate synthase/N-acetylneuraminate lyase